MSPHHHPSEALISAYAAGLLRPGAGLIVRAHLDLCVDCRRTARFFDGVGGALIEAEPPAPLAPDALDRALAAIERPEPVAAPQTSPAVRDLDLGRRRWMAPGVWMTPVKTDRSSRERVYLLRIDGGMVLPRHTHHGCEFTCVLEGSFSDASGRYAAGDFISADDEVEHSPVVDADGACVCLISTDAPLVMRDLIGRLLQPFAGV